MSNNNETNSFTSGPILSPFLKFTFPILISMFLQALYSAVDLIVISRYCGPAESAAVSSGCNVSPSGSCHRACYGCYCSNRVLYRRE